MPIKKGNTVVVEYEGRLESGEVFDSSSHGDHSHPLTFTAGNGEVIKGFDNAVIGMEINQEKEVKIKPSEAYGDYSENLKQSIPKEALKMEKEPKVGMVLVLASPDGRKASAPIVAVDKKNVTIDLNHPLAGKTLIFKIKVVKIEKN